MPRRTDRVPSIFRAAATYLRWLGWMLYYLPRRRPKELGPWLIRAERTRPPWWKFKPNVWHNDHGRQWEVYFKDDMDFCRIQTMQVDAHISQETGEIVGLTIYDETLRPQAEEKCSA